ncbi:MAG: PSD1 and planctomycete cytochrome C domain-containing protein [Pirellulaceae bacterium]
MKSYGAGIAVLAFAVAIGAGSAYAAEEPASFFEHRIAPILESRCVSCHSAENEKGGLNITSRESLLNGGDSGPSVVPGEVDESWFLDMVSGDEPEMPKDSKPLTAEQIGDLRKWIKGGAEWPKNAKVRAQLWSLRPVVRTEVPEVQNQQWVRNPIDAFILRRLETEGLAPAPAADKLTLIRRATFDLHGLPPTPQQIDEFLADNSEDAFANLVNRLLESPRYGERWGRHWLDLASYADSHGFELDYPRPNAWRYRDYVIESFNEDTPYDEFLLEQLAGDVIAPDDPSAAVATGFLGAGPWDYSGFITAIQGTAVARGTRHRDLDNMMTTVMTATTGLTVGCAQCHDHKFDPISQKDYYSLKAVFAGVRRGDRITRGDATQEQARQMEQIRLAIHKKRIGVGEITARLPEDRTEEMEESLAKLRQEIAELEAEYAKFPEVELTYGVIPDAPPATHILARGNTEAPLDEVAPAALSAVKNIPAGLTNADAPEGARRLALAKWLTDPENPLTARVAVNRLWQRHFGRGIVGTPGDFGFNGEQPSHPELLDWLAREFQRRDWSIKEMHRLIMLSSSYRQATQHNDQAAAIDADNRLLWRMNRRRLDAEVVRDSVLAVSGQLDLTMSGRADKAFHYEFRKSPVYDYYATSDRPESNRRSVYQFIPRSTPDPFMDVLDFPIPSSCTPVRNSTTTPLQSLSLLNDPFMIDQAEHLAKRLVESHPDEVAAQVTLAYRLAYGRGPSASERKRATQFIATHELFHFCRAIFNTNEFLYVD